MNKIEGKPSKKAFQGEIKSTYDLHDISKYTDYSTEYLKKVLEKLKANGASDEKIKDFQATAQGGVKKILANYDNYDMYMGESMEEDSMYVLVDFREDGVTPYATVWKHGLEEYKV